MKSTLFRTNSLRNRTSLSLNINFSATEQSPPQSFDRLLLQQQERVPEVIRISIGVPLHDSADKRQNIPDWQPRHCSLIPPCG
jgi:hypothetical protein